jgi:hypothetical protein
MENQFGVDENISAIMQKLYADLPSDAIQRTEGALTKKGYDTTGYGYQWCIDRLNSVFNLDWHYDFEILKVIESITSKGRPQYSITVKISMTVMHSKPRLLVGGHTSTDYADALKGAITNGLKKTAALFGVGSKAFRGQIDDDNLDSDLDHDEKEFDLFSAVNGMIADAKKMSLSIEEKTFFSGIVNQLNSGKYTKSLYDEDVKFFEELKNKYNNEGRR